MRSAKDFFKPLATGAPAPVREVPTRPSRMITSSTRAIRRWRRRSRTWSARPTSCSATSGTPSSPTRRRPLARGLITIAKETDFGEHTQLWTRINSVHAILETARGMVNVEEIAGASPRIQGISLGLADLKGVLAAWQEGAGVVTFNGAMIENLNVDIARRVLATHEAILARS